MFPIIPSISPKTPQQVQIIRRLLSARWEMHDCTNIAVHFTLASRQQTLHAVAIHHANSALTLQRSSLCYSVLYLIARYALISLKKMVLPAKRRAVPLSVSLLVSVSAPSFHGITEVGRKLGRCLVHKAAKSMSRCKVRSCFVRSPKPSRMEIPQPLCCLMLRCPQREKGSP